ncbi:hypothetical protein AGMMS49991_04610 [Spirochaetia bacterium]|nr:hypothetical protein AGMMS49991_04610 [Spirochaetia bacterium]
MEQETKDQVIKYREMARQALDDDAGPDKAVRELLSIAEKLGYEETWVHDQIQPRKYVIDMRVLHSIARVKGYKPWRVSVMKKKVIAGIESKRDIPNFQTDDPCLK